MVKKHVPRKNLRSKRWLWIGGALGLGAGALVVWFALANPFRAPTPRANALDIAANLPSSDIAFNVDTRIGQLAPAFTLPDAQGQPYTFKPGDGRTYLLAFNMGFV